MEGGGRDYVAVEERRREPNTRRERKEIGEEGGKREGGRTNVAGDPAMKVPRPPEVSRFITAYRPAVKRREGGGRRIRGGRGTYVAVELAMKVPRPPEVCWPITAMSRGALHHHIVQLK
jgi:hypothetical protein